MLAALVAAFLVLFSGDPGLRLNREAWLASYEERGLRPPRDEPREGYWGARLRDEDGRALRVPVSLPGRVEIDAEYRQWAGAEDANLRLVVVGGSVAWGAYASEEQTTWFAQLARLLTAKGLSTRVVNLARGGWSSPREARVLAARLDQLDADAVLAVNGLNDLALRGDVPLEQRVDDYVDAVVRMQATADAAGVPFVVAVQPGLELDASPTALERRLLEATFEPGNHHDPRCTPEEMAAAHRSLAERLRGAGVRRVVDLSDLLSSERHTTFADLWHFSDPGHERLADALLAPVEEALRAGRDEAPR